MDRVCCECSCSSGSAEPLCFLRSARFSPRSVALMIVGCASASGWAATHLGEKGRAKKAVYRWFRENMGGHSKLPHMFPYLTGMASKWTRPRAALQPFFPEKGAKERAAASERKTP